METRIYGISADLEYWREHMTTSQTPPERMPLLETTAIVSPVIESRPFLA